MCYTAINIEYIRALKEYEQIVRDKKLMLKGLKYGYYTFAILLIIAILLSGNYVLAFIPKTSASNLNYNFQSTSLYDGSLPTNVSLSNFSNQTIWTYYNNTSEESGLSYDYHGTYDFLNNSIPPEIVNVGSGSSQITIVSSFGTPNHNYTLRQYDPDSSSSARIYINFTTHPMENGSVSFYVSSTNINNAYEIWLMSGNYFDTPINCFGIRLYASMIQYNDGTWEGTSKYISNNIWYWIRIDFECTINGYLGLSQYKWRFNCTGGGSSYLSPNVNFNTNADYIDGIRTASSTTSSSYTNYMDSIILGYDSNFEITDNLYPYGSNSGGYDEYWIHTTTDVMEINHFTFDTDESGNLLIDTPIYDIPFWNKEGNDDYVSLVSSVFNSTGCSLEMANIEPYISGIYKNFDVQTPIIRMKWNFRSYSVITTPNSYYSVEIFDTESNLITCLNFTFVSGTNSLKYYNGSVYQTLTTSLSYNTNYFPSIILGYDVGNITIGGNDYTFSLVNEVSSIGLVRFRVYQYSDTSPFANIEVVMDNVGIFTNESSLAFGSFGSAYYDLNVSEWNNVENPYFNCNFIGNASIAVSNVGNKGSILFSYDNYNGTLFRNFYKTIFDSSPPTIPNEFYLAYTLSNPKIIIIANSSFTLSSMSITGIKLTDGTNEYLPEYTWNNVNANYSYFYGVNSYMYYDFTCNTSNDEFMSVYFDVPNLELTYYAIGIDYLYKNTSLAIANFRIMYSDDSYSTVSATTISQSYYFILPASKVLNGFKMLISESEYNTSLLGYIKGIHIYYRPDLDTPITTAGFMDILPFLILVVFVPVVMMLKWKLKLPILTPAMFLMTIFAVANDIIPLWLGFVICLSLVLYWIINRKVRG